MNERTIVALVTLLFLLSLGSAHAGEDLPGSPVPRGRRATAGFSPIVNKVIDLLDTEIELATDGGDTWQSETFNAAQFARIGLRMSGEVEAGLISCAVAWQFSPEDEFQITRPSAGIGVYPGDFGRVPEGSEGDPGETPGPLDVPDSGPRLDGFADLYILSPGWVISSPLSSFAEVCGLRARVVCRLSPGGGVVFTEPGEDPAEPEPVTGTLSDVKVLLRSE